MIGFWHFLFQPLLERLPAGITRFSEIFPKVLAVLKEILYYGFPFFLAVFSLGVILVMKFFFGLIFIVPVP